MITSSRIQNLHPYVPGEQPKDRVYIKLNANENPYPPSKKVQKAVMDFVQNNPEKLGLYPDPDSLELHAAIADMRGCSVGNDRRRFLEEVHENTVRFYGKRL